MEYVPLPERRRQRLRFHGRQRILEPQMSRASSLDVLPSELRNLIYEYVYSPVVVVKMRSHFAHHIRGSPFDSGPRRRERQTVYVDRKMSKWRPSFDVPMEWAESLPALVLVNKQIYREAIPYLYGNNVFLFENTQFSHAFLDAVPAINLACVTQIRLVSQVPYHDYDNAGGLPRMCRHLVDKLPNLESLDIEVEVLRWIESGPQGSNGCTSAKILSPPDGSTRSDSSPAWRS